MDNGVSGREGKYTSKHLMQTSFVVRNLS